MKIVFFTMIIVIFVVVICCIIIAQAKLNPNKSSRINNVGNRVRDFFIRHKHPLKSIKKIVIVISVIIIGYFYWMGLPTNSKAEDYIDDYIQNSTDVELYYLEPDEMQAMRQESHKEYTSEIYEKHSEIIDKYHNSQTIYTGMTFFGNRTKMKEVEFNTIIFKDEKTRKYFQIMYAARKKSQLFTVSTFLDDGVHLKARVNKSDLRNSAYGKVENPIPVFMFSIPKREGWKDYEAEKITEEQYRNSVYYYLAYIMPKEEFNERFKDE